MNKLGIRSKILTLLVVLCLLTSITETVFAITNGQPDGDAHPYVCLVVADVGGEPAWRGTGVLLSPTVVLTAGHVTDGADAIRVWFDEVVEGNPDYPAGGLSAIEGTPYTHPEFSIGAGKGLPEYMHYDIGIIVLDEPVEMDEYGELPDPGIVDTLRPMTDVDLVGYGVQERIRGRGQSYWTGLIVRFYAPAKTLSNKFSWADEFMRCTANPGHDKGGIAFGDSGGPVLLGDTNMVLAVNSYVTNKNCAGVTYHCRIDIPEIIDWIEDIIEPPPIPDPDVD